MALNYTHDEAYKLLLRFRHIHEAIKGFMMLSTANVHITDIPNSQLIVGTRSDDALFAAVINFGYHYGEIFDGLCALSSSSTPVIIKHTLISKDEKFLDAFRSSRLGLYAATTDVTRTSSELNISLSANIKYP